MMEATDSTGYTMNVFTATVPTRLGPQSNGLPMTIEEFEAVTDWDERFRYELVHGIVIVSPAPSIGERKPNDVLGYLLQTYAERHESTLDETVPEHDIVTSSGVRRADRVVWCGLGRLPDPRDDVPTIVIEFVSRGSRDRNRDYVVKRAEYAALGIAEYWVINRFDRSLTVCLADGSHVVVPEDETYTTDRLPGFELPLARLLAAADRYLGE